MTANLSQTDKKVVHVPKAMAAEIAAFRFGRMIGSEAEAIRKLISKGLEAAKAEGLGESGAVA